jgi:hypothetical protein
VADSVLRRVGAGAVAWVVGAVAFLAMAHPMSCDAPTARAAMDGVRAAVGWLAANQNEDGSFVYSYDRDTGTESPGYVTARHAGTILALEQARRAGVDAAGAPAEAAIDWADERLVPLPGDRLALGGDTGSSALFVDALVERRRIDGPDAAADDRLDRLGRFLVGAVTDRGAVVAEWDLARDEPVAASRSPFFTGEVLLALTRLAVERPDGGFAAPARRVAQYLATERDDAERRLPPVSDHWASYAFAELAAWPAALGPGLTPEVRASARRQAGLLGLQVRFEAQRRSSGLAHLTRGRQALTSGLGTVGEGLGGIWRLTGQTPVAGVDRSTVADRLACVAGLLVARQSHGEDPRVAGAWFRAGDTRVDDQQHAISALLAAVPVLPDRTHPS